MGLETISRVSVPESLPSVTSLHWEMKMIRKRGEEETELLGAEIKRGVESS